MKHIIVSVFLHTGRSLHSTVLTEEEYSIHYVVGVLNINLLSYFYRSISQETGRAQAWPSFNPDLIQPEKLDIVVQVNGKTRQVIQVAPDADEDKLKQLVMSLDKVKGYLRDKQVKRTIYVPGRVINLIT